MQNDRPLAAVWGMMEVWGVQNDPLCQFGVWWRGSVCRTTPYDSLVYGGGVGCAEQPLVAVWGMVEG